MAVKERVKPSAQKGKKKKQKRPAEEEKENSRKKRVTRTRNITTPSRFKWVPSLKTVGLYIFVENADIVLWGALCPENIYSDQNASIDIIPLI